MNEVNWNDCADEELLYFVVKLGKDLAKKDYIIKKDNKVLIRKKHRNKNKEKTIQKNIPSKEPSYSDIKNAIGYPPATLYLNRFGSWERALYLAGFDENFNYYWKKSTDELINDVTEETNFSKEFVAKMFEGLDKVDRNPRKKQEKNSNSYDCSLPAYHLA